MKFFHLILISLLLSFLWMGTAQAAGLSNAASPQDVPTYYVPDDETVHPDVVVFTNAWNGYKYWMAMTPYSDGNDDYENPSIVASNDGATWEVPAGLTNPVIAFPGGAAFNSDPDLIYNSATDELWMYYRDSPGVCTANGTVKLTKSSDGVTWGSSATVLSGFNTCSMLSQSIVKVGSTYYMFAVNAGTSVSIFPFYIDRYTSSDGETWGSAQRVTEIPDNRIIWHINVDYVDSEYRMIASSFTSATSATTGDLSFYTSSNGMQWNYYPTLAMTRRSGQWDAGLYRTTISYVGDTMDVWYSATTSPAANYFIGYTTSAYSIFLSNLGTEVAYTNPNPGGIQAAGVTFQGITFN